jgi:uncharacterized protein YyaL (SSP411 family)
MPNRLAKEKSPYLLQHADNPVDWYPWSDEAFARTAEEDKPVFLSIGYATCHWCHVMEHESFQDQEVADLLNTTFICIKVDREERPDIDALYMSICSMMTGGGGWPLTIIMTPDKKPFFAGTYFAKYSGLGRIGMIDLITRIREVWLDRRDDVEKSADNIMDLLQQQTRLRPGADLDENIIDAAFNELSRRYDSSNGGFSSAPKFPTPHIITFLLRYWEMSGNDQVLAMVKHTLTAMRLGGIYDHIGFGFHRYSTDEKWLLPHFEKMLYDQALLAVAYTETYQVTGTPLFKQTAQEIFAYVLRDMTAPEGAFYSAEDADSEGIEGKFYVWTIGELQNVLSSRELDIVRNLYNIKTGGNFHEEATGTLSGANIFHLKASVPNMVDDSTLRMETRDKIEAIREKLFRARKKRVHPLKDDKILTDWNGLMIGAFAIGARIFNDNKYLEAAQKAADFILSAMCDKHKKLLHRYRDGDCAITGMLSDYAFLVWGLLELYITDLKPNILREAINLNNRMVDFFWDYDAGGFFMTSHDGESLPVRTKDIYDGAFPSGNSIALSNLLRLERLTANPELGRKAKLLVQNFSESLTDSPSAYTQFLSGLCFALRPATEIVVAGNRYANDTREMLAIIRNKFSPGSTLLFKDTSSVAEELAILAPFTAEYTALDDRATAYVCRDQSCHPPTNDLEQLKKFLRHKNISGKID